MDEILLQDPELAQAIILESQRQVTKLELIASENFVSPAVREAQGSVMTHKYAEGYPGKRYYGGCEYVDIAENLAIERAKKLFGCEYANVQPHSGSQANMGAYFSFLKPGDTILGMDLSHGGHLTHGSPVNFSGKLFNNVFYGVNRETGCIDYDEVARIAREHKPAAIVAGASAYPRKIDFARFRAIADEVGAVLMVDMAHIAGLVAAGLHPSPVPHADIVTSTSHKTLRGPRGGFILTNSDELGPKINKAIFPGAQGGPLMHVIAGKAVCFGEALQPAFRAYQQQVVKNAAVLAETLQQGGVRLVSGGTDNHLMLADVYSRGRTGAQMQDLLDAANITANKNTIPFDTQSVRVTSGVRLGTPAVTTRGMGEGEMREIGALICRLIDEGEAAVPAVRAQVLDLCARFPLYPDLHM